MENPVKKLIALFVLFAALLFVAPIQHVVAQQRTVQLAEDPQSTTVYITKTGKKYHKDGCRYLSQSKIKTTLKEAKANGYTACKVCHPPQ
jgi:biopolymer transport protein ExbD